MKLMNFASRLVLCAIATSASRGEGHPESQEPESRERFVCISGATPRFVDIYRLASPDGGGGGGGCRVDYTKDGVTQSVWSSRGDYAYCVKNALALVTKLTKDRFLCKPQTADSPGRVE